MASEPIELFARKFQAGGLTECWPWLAGHDQNGYGMFRSRRLFPKMERAHRVMWLFENVRIPQEMKVLHTCDNPSCVNPNHLFLGTQADNVKDMERKGRRRSYFGPHPWRKNLSRDMKGRFHGK